AAGPLARRPRPRRRAAGAQPGRAALRGRGAALARTQVVRAARRTDRGDPPARRLLPVRALARRTGAQRAHLPRLRRRGGARGGRRGAGGGVGEALRGRRGTAMRRVLIRTVVAALAGMQCACGPGREVPEEEVYSVVLAEVAARLDLAPPIFVHPAKA